MIRFFRDGRWKFLPVAILAAQFSLSASGTEPCCCSGCGCGGEVQKVCRLVCEEKKITTTCWAATSEDFCIPGPSKPGCEHEKCVCGDLGDATVPCPAPKTITWLEWIPNACAKIHTRKKLMKRTVTTTVPSYKWVVEELCPRCQQVHASIDVPSGTAIPPVPTVNGARVLPTASVASAERGLSTAAVGGEIVSAK